MSTKTKSKKPKGKKVEKKAAPKKEAKKPLKAASAAAPKASAKPAPKKVEKVEETEADKKRAKAAAAVKAAMAATPEEEEEFDPAAFFAASGGKGLFKAHVMRKERVDFNLNVRFRFLNSPLVHNAELLNLSKGGLCLKTAETVKAKTVVRIEIPLPHTSELFAVQAEVVWSDSMGGKGKDRPIHTGLKFLPMSLAKQTVINQFIQQRRDEIIMAKIGLDKFTDSVPVAGLD